MAASNHKIYDNFFLESQIEDQFNSAIDLQNYFVVDTTLSEGPGMVKKINRYSASDATQELAMGEGNTQTIEVTFNTFEYRVKLAQNEFDYYDEQAMTDDMIVPTGIRRMASGMFNKVDSDFMAELKKASRVIYGTSWDIDYFADAVGLLDVAGTDNAPESLRPFCFMNPQDIATIRALAKETLQYNESYARTGYVGSLYGVDIISKKNQTKGQTEIALTQAATIFLKPGIEADQDRDGNTRLNKMWSRKYYIAALTDDTKVVRIIIGSGSASIALNKSSTSIVAGASETLTATINPTGVAVSWSSSDTDVATVDASGKVVGVAAGSATITAKITVNQTEYTDTCAVTVTAEG